jgi:hypothetical protein
MSIPAKTANPNHEIAAGLFNIEDWRAVVLTETVTAWGEVPISVAKPSGNLLGLSVQVDLGGNPAQVTVTLSLKPAPPTARRLYVAA